MNFWGITASSCNAMHFLRRPGKADFCRNQAIMFEDYNIDVTEVKVLQYREDIAITAHIQVPIQLATWTTGGWCEKFGGTEVYCAREITVTHSSLTVTFFFNS